MSKYCCWLVIEFYFDSYVYFDVVCSLLDIYICSFLGCLYIALWGYREVGFVYIYFYLNNEKYKCNYIMCFIS